MLSKFIIAGVITTAIVATTVEIVFPPKPKLLYNPSPSAAIGWYRLRKDEPPIIASQVAAYAPDWARKMADERGYLPYDYPLIKTVWAVEGDEVCYHKNWVSGPNFPDVEMKLQDSLGRDMPVKLGCVVLKPGEYFLVSPDVQTGFDSRYFGPVGIENILGQVEYLGKPKNLRLPEKRDLEGFEG